MNPYQARAQRKAAIINRFIGSSANDEVAKADQDLLKLLVRDREFVSRATQRSNPINDVYTQKVMDAGRPQPSKSMFANRDGGWLDKQHSK